MRVNVGISEHFVYSQVAGQASASVAFPAGWNNTRPWFIAQGQQQPHSPQQQQRSGSGGAPAATAPSPGGGVRPVMPPPAFPSQPWQGSRLGPLPPLEIYPDWPGWRRQPSKARPSFAWPLQP